MGCQQFHPCFSPLPCLLLARIMRLLLAQCCVTGYNGEWWRGIYFFFLLYAYNKRKHCSKLTEGEKSFPGTLSSYTSSSCSSAPSPLWVLGGSHTELGPLTAHTCCCQLLGLPWSVCELTKHWGQDQQDGACCRCCGWIGVKHGGMPLPSHLTSWGIQEGLTSSQ